ncbi:MAG: hypothetical protein WCX65_11145 [bacterium]
MGLFSRPKYGNFSEKEMDRFARSLETYVDSLKLLIPNEIYRLNSNVFDPSTKSWENIDEYDKWIKKYRLKGFVSFNCDINNGETKIYCDRPCGSDSTLLNVIRINNNEVHYAASNGTYYSIRVSRFSNITIVYMNKNYKIAIDDIGAVLDMSRDYDEGRLCKMDVNLFHHGKWTNEIMAMSKLVLELAPKHEKLRHNQEKAKAKEDKKARFKPLNE